ncbi:DUF3365 domain-containing protein [Algoriphagus sp.]|uniref:Tll0287-like domain-containing protein n=1 Tax=Algoriphagus sp. TaxID=1872435 RepID=UPI002600C0C2|nr:DUF3365 domain-containing protein [Algoriphagus sp.]
MKNRYTYILLVSIIISCGPRERVSKEVFDEVNKNMEIKRLTEVEIIQEAMIWGDSISKSAQENLITNLQKAIEEGGMPHAIEFCKENASQITNISEDILIRRVSTKNRNSNNYPDSQESPILDAYAYNAENGLESEPNIQKIENGEVYLYTKAIIFPGGICLSCHGEPGSQISDPVLNALENLYPEDNAKGYKMGELRGMWSLRIPKKKVVDRL